MEAVLAGARSTWSFVGTSKRVKDLVDTNLGWIDIPRFEFEILGTDGSSVHIASTNVLAKTSVVAFDGVVTLRTTYSTFTHSFHFADYNGPRHFRDRLSAIRNGSNEFASMGDNRFAITVGVHRVGVRESLLIEGCCSSIDDLTHSAWPPRPTIGELVLLDHTSIGCLRFAFLSSLIDSPWIDNAIAAINSMIQYLEDEGFES